MKKNKWQLAREIPSPVKREVRQRCGFGCIICGKALIEYHHSTTKYSVAEEHNPNEIVLLCGGCHNEVTRGWLSDESIDEALQNPRCLQDGFSFGAFDAGRKNIEVTAGTLTITNTKTLIRIFGQPIFCIDEPEGDNAPFRISALFSDKYGNKSLLIQENEWQVLSQNWDVEVIKNRIIVRRASREIALVLRTEARKSIIIERLDMVYEGVQIFCRENKEISISLPNGNFFRSSLAKLENCDVGIDVNEEGTQIGCNCEEAQFDEIDVISN